MHYNPVIFIVLISFTLPFLFAYSYTSCSINSKNEFICCCMYKNSAEIKREGGLVFAIGVKSKESLDRVSSLLLARKFQYVLNYYCNPSMFYTVNSQLYRCPMEATPHEPPLPPEA